MPLFLKPPHCFWPLPTALSPHIALENALWLIVVKPPFMPCTPTPLSPTSFSVIDWVRQHYPFANQMGLAYEFGLVHRLDNATSGLLLFAKTPEEHHRLRRLWKTPWVTKHYLCVAKAPQTSLVVPPQEIGVWIGHDKKSAKKMRAHRCPQHLAPKIRGHARLSRTLLLKKTPLEEGWYQWHVILKTGIRHQIRLCFASLECPLLGDALYHGVASPRLHLHAQALILPDPFDHEILVESPL